MEPLWKEDPYIAVSFYRDTSISENPYMGMPYVGSPLYTKMCLRLPQGQNMQLVSYADIEAWSLFRRT